jgi:hypothetical protein
MMLSLRHPRHALCSLLAGTVRSEDMTLVAGDLHAMIATGAESAFAIERADSAGPGADRIERVEAGELHIELGPGMVVEGRQRPAGRGIPFAIDLAGLAPDPP